MIGGISHKLCHFRQVSAKFRGRPNVGLDMDTDQCSVAQAGITTDPAERPAYLFRTPFSDGQVCRPNAHLSAFFVCRRGFAQTRRGLAQKRAGRNARLQQGVLLESLFVHKTEQNEGQKTCSSYVSWRPAQHSPVLQPAVTPLGNRHLSAAARAPSPQWRLTRTRSSAQPSVLRGTCCIATRNPVSADPSQGQTKGHTKPLIHNARQSVRSADMQITALDPLIRRGFCVRHTSRRRT